MEFPNVDLDAEAKPSGLLLYFPWGSIVVILIFLASLGFFGWRNVDSRLAELTSTLTSVSHSADELSTELRNIREFYSTLDKKVAVIDTRLSAIEQPKKRNSRVDESLEE